MILETRTVSAPRRAMMIGAQAAGGFRSGMTIETQVASGPHSGMTIGTQVAAGSRRATILRARAISSLILDNLSRAGVAGRVHSIFAQTVNVLCEESPYIWSGGMNARRGGPHRARSGINAGRCMEGRCCGIEDVAGRSLSRPGLWVSIHAAGVPMHPHAVRLEAGAYAPRALDGLGLRRGDEVRLTGAEIRFGCGRLRVRIADAAAWDPAPHRPGHGVLPPAWAVDMMLKSIEARGITSPFLREAHNLRGAERALVERCRNVRSHLRAAWRRGRVDSIGRVMMEAVGLGGGLTPSGDDFLTGFLGAAHYFERRTGFRDRLWRSLRIEPQMTTLPSFFMLEGALRGFLPEPLSDLLGALGEKGPEEVRRCAGWLAGLGAMSGQDMLAGVICYVEAAEAAEGVQ